MAVVLSLNSFGRLDHDIGRAGDEIVRLQQPIDRSFRDKILFLVGEAHGQLSRRQFGDLQRQIDDLAADIVRDPVPDTIRSGTVVTSASGPPARYRSYQR